MARAGGRERGSPPRAPARAASGAGAATEGIRRPEGRGLSRLRCPALVVSASSAVRTAAAQSPPESFPAGVRWLGLPPVGGPMASPGTLPRWESVRRERGPIPDASHRLDQMLVLGSELGAKPPDVHDDRPRAPVEVVAPDLAQQRGPGEDPARLLREEPQQLELLERQIERPARGRHAVGLGIDR